MRGGGELHLRKVIRQEHTLKFSGFNIPTYSVLGSDHVT